MGHVNVNDLSFQPVETANWPDLETLFGVNGACGGCWCMLWRLRKKAYDAGKGAGNKSALWNRVKQPMPPGLLVYSGSEAIAWCSLGPREHFPRLARSRILKPVDEQPVWSITCLFVKKQWRTMGVSTYALRSAQRFALKYGAEILEGYPYDPIEGKMPDVFAWTGIASSYRKAGFIEVARRSVKRPVMRVQLKP